MTGKRNPKGGKYHGQVLKDFRSKVSKSKKLGIISNKVDARSQKPTRYMIGKLNKFADVIEGKVAAVKASPKVRDQYRDSGIYPSRGSFLIVPIEHKKQKTKIAQGRAVEITVPVGTGFTMRRVVLPIAAVDMPSLVRELRNNPSLDGLKRPTDQFGFRIYGHNSLRGLVDVEELADYIERRYAHLFKPKNARDGFKNFELFSFSGRRLPPAPKEGKIYNKGYDRKKKKDGTYEQRNLTLNREKQAKRRAERTQEQYEADLIKQREQRRILRAKAKGVDL